MTTEHFPLWPFYGISNSIVSEMGFIIYSHDAVPEFGEENISEKLMSSPLPCETVLPVQDMKP